MAVTNGMFLFEVVVDNVKSFVESRNLIIKSDFADIFSLELKDPKQMHIVIPDPPPLPPDPPGKKKGKKPPKPKKGKKGAVVAPPPEPCIQSGQSVLFSSSAEFLIQNMRKFPVELSLWSKEDNLVFIGNSFIPWDPVFVKYLERILNCEQPLPVTVKDEYNIFEEGTAKLMAKVGIQIKLSYLTDKVTTAFRTLSEDPTVKKVLYTGINSKTTSYICTLKTTDEDFEENCNKIENNYIIDKPKPKIAYADYKNAPGANLTFFNEGDYCCMTLADKPPDSLYKAPETSPDIDFIVDYVRKIIVSCNDNLRMLTPRPTIRPRIKATDIDRLCYCKETQWPDGKLAQMFKKEAQSEPCSLCINAGKKVDGNHGATFDIGNIRGPCGKPDCRIARELRAYIENLVEEDQQVVDINQIIGPCGSKECTIAEKIQQLLRREGPFKQGRTQEGLASQCACLQQMQEELTKRKSCETICSKDCEDSDTDTCGGTGCPYGNKVEQVYNVYYFTVEYDFVNTPTDTTSDSKTDKFLHCRSDCPNSNPSGTSCSKATCTRSTCSALLELPKEVEHGNKTCPTISCPDFKTYPLSPKDSNVIINLEDIHNPCCVKSCNVAETVKDFIEDVVRSKNNRQAIPEKDPCYCDCECTFKFPRKTSYCATCGGYECLGYDMQDQPEFMKPHPCPIYHKMYDRKYINVPNPWPDEETSLDQMNEPRKKPPSDNASVKSWKAASGSRSMGRITGSRSVKDDKRGTKQGNHDVAKPQPNKDKKKIGKFTANVEKSQILPVVEKKTEPKYPYPPVPKNKGWNWTAEDIPGMKPRPKWRPGAVNKILVRKYRAIREGGDVLAKKKRALMQRKKKIEMKPTLVVKKQDGEYTVQMEVFKKYSKERLIFQYPYDEKPPLMYTIGRTEEEKRKIQRQRERRERRETRRKNRLIQSTFRDKCQEICLKAYNQAIGLLPLPNPNEPECPCQTKAAGVISPAVDSCSCSEDGSIASSDTDGDNWVIEFTPPAARWDVKAKHSPALAENETQYSYLDYKVKILDKSGNQVPRYFKGPDGKQECSDLGGFWGPGHVWTEINKDGYIGPDNRWVPMNFIGPDGMFYSAEEGQFTDSSNRILKIGIDGYVDKDGKWASYRGTRSAKSSVSDVHKKGNVNNKSVPAKGKVENKVTSTSPTKEKGAKPAVKEKRGALKSDDKGAKFRPGKNKSPVVMSVSTTYHKMNNNYRPSVSRTQKSRLRKVDSMKLVRYREIMHGLGEYEDLGDLKPRLKTDRASNTNSPKIQYSPLTMYGDRYTHTLQPVTSLHRSDTTTSCCP